MLRAVLFAVLVACILSAPVEAQRAGGVFRSSPAGMGVSSGFVAQRGVPTLTSPIGFFPRHGLFPKHRVHSRHSGFGSVVVPYFPLYAEPLELDQSYDEALTPPPVPPPVVILQRDEGQSHVPEPPAAKAQIIEVPGTGTATPSKPPTIFILTNGERLETRRFVLTADHLSVGIDRKQRTMPVSMLDVNATLAANHERGIDLRIPSDQHEISLRF